jgi:hypothetical protein
MEVLMYASRSLSYRGAAVRRNRIPLTLVLVVGFAIVGLVASAIAAICIPEFTTTIASVAGT